jgi:hypothetical protein
MIGLLAGGPQDAVKWGRLCKEAVEAMEDSRASFHLTEKQINHCRRAFPAVAVGISYGNGTLVSAPKPTSVAS